MRNKGENTYRSHECEIGQHKSRCPRVSPERTWPDPARKGATYTTPRRVCSCDCHRRSRRSIEDVPLPEG